MVKTVTNKRLKSLRVRLSFQLLSSTHIQHTQQSKPRQFLYEIFLLNTNSSVPTSTQLEIVRLTAKRMQLKRQSDDISNSVERARETQSELAKSVEQEAQETELLIRQYEDTLQEIADRFRKTRGYYHEEEVNKETENVNAKVSELEDELQKRQAMVDELKSQLNQLKPSLPEDLLYIIGNVELDAKVKELTEKLEALNDKHKLLVNRNNFMNFSTEKK